MNTPRLFEPRPEMPKTVACRVCFDAGIIQIEGQPQAHFYREIFLYNMPCPMKCETEKVWAKEFEAYRQKVELLGPEIAGTDAATAHWWGGKLYADKAEVQRLAREWRAKGARIG